MQITNQVITVSNVTMPLEKALRNFRRAYGFEPDGNGQPELEILAAMTAETLTQLIIQEKEAIAYNRDMNVSDVKLPDVKMLELASTFKQTLEEALDYMTLIEEVYKIKTTVKNK